MKSKFLFSDMAESDEYLQRSARSIVSRERCEAIFNLGVPSESASEFDERDEIDKALDLLRADDEAAKECAMKVLEKLRSSIYPKKPLLLRKFRPGWMDNPKNPINVKNRRAAYAAMLEAVGDHLADGLNMEDLPDEGCDRNCSCLIRKRVVGDRGGMSRRVPCQLLQRKGMKRFERQMILMVSWFQCLQFEKIVHKNAPAFT